MRLTHSESEAPAVEPVVTPEAPVADVRATFISPRVIALAWFVAMLVATAVNPATTEAVQPTLVLTVLANVAAFAWLATLVVGVLNWRHTPTLALATGHFICGFNGHLPMTGWIWLTQLMAVATATTLSALALATRR